MIVAFLAVVALGQNSVLSKVVPSPTGRNGYEEYVQAAMILERPEGRAVESYVRLLETGTGEKAEGARPATIPSGATLLEAYRAQLKLVAPALDLIRKGSQKQVAYPAESVSEFTLFPELAYFKQVGRLFQRQAYVDFAEGKPAAGTQSILDGLVFSKKIAVGGLIHFLVSGSIEQFMLSSVRQHLDRLSQHDAERLQSWAEGALAAGSAYGAACEVERKSLRQTFFDAFAHPTEILQTQDLEQSEEDRERFARDVAAIPLARREEFYHRFFERLEAPWAAAEERLRQPESTWLEPIEVPTVAGDSPAKADLQGTEGTVALGTLRLMTLLGVGDDSIAAGVSTAARFRIQERLLRLYAGVLRFKWENGRLPTALRDAFGQDATDPATGQLYIFEPDGAGSFRIVCPSAKLGEVDLVYKESEDDRDVGATPPRF